ncbi:MAG: hypothetical protein ABI480_15975 [Chitinophagaceae bacterium]
MKIKFYEAEAKKRAEQECSVPLSLRSFSVFSTLTTLVSLYEYVSSSIPYFKLISNLSLFKDYPVFL